MFDLRVISVVSKLRLLIKQKLLLAIGEQIYSNLMKLTTASNFLAMFNPRNLLHLNTFVFLIIYLVKCNLRYLIRN